MHANDDRSQWHAVKNTSWKVVDLLEAPDGAEFASTEGNILASLDGRSEGDLDECNGNGVLSGGLGTGVAIKTAPPLAVVGSEVKPRTLLGYVL